MRRIATLLVALLLSGGALLATGATPVQAHYPDGTLRNVYSDRDFCQWYGSYGVQNGLWDSYICEFHQYGTSTYWFLWSFGD